MTPITREMILTALARLGAQPPPAIDSPAWDPVAEAIGEALLHERAQLPPVVIGTCEATVDEERCPSPGMLTRANGRLLDTGGREIGGRGSFTVFLCPKHGATLERAVRRWPR